MNTEINQIQSSSSATWSPKDLGTIFASFYIPSIETMATEINYFPGSTCIPSWGLKGHFFATLHAYHQGKLAVQLSLQHCDETGVLSIGSDDLLTVLGKDYEGLGVIEIRHSPQIPMEMYVSHIHKKSGVYVAYPPAVFMGDQIYVSGHAKHLENSLFWPGIVETETQESCLRVLNPFNVPFHYQLILFSPDGTRSSTAVYKLRPFASALHTVGENFPELVQKIREDSSKGYSLCISAQFKTCAHMVIRERSTGIPTTIDHLHQYCMY